MMTRALSVLIVALVLPVLAPAGSSAGLYTHRACADGDTGLFDHEAGWSVESPLAPAGVKAVSGCPQAGLALAVNGSQGHAGDGLAQGVGLDIGTGPAWRYRPPAGTRVIAFAGDVRGWLRPWSGAAAVTAVVAGPGHVLRRYTAADDPALSTRSRLLLSGLSEGWLLVKLECTGSAGRCEGPDDWAWLDVRNVDVGIADDQPPAVTAGPTGALVGRPTLSGEAGIDVVLDDAGGGVRHLQVLVDGDVLQTIVTAGGRCEPVAGQPGSWVFRAAQPCPASIRVNAAIDSRRIADGRHDLRVVAVDAAGNATTVYHAAKTVDNTPAQPTRPPGFEPGAEVTHPVAGAAIGGDAGGWDRADAVVGYQWERCDATGARCRAIDGATAARYTPTSADVGARLRLVVTATVPGGSRSEATPLTGVVVAAADEACRGRLRLTRSGTGVVRVGYAAKASVRLTLTCGEDRDPVVGARLFVRERVSGRAREGEATVLRTGRTGRVRLDLGHGPSRTVIVTTAGGDGPRLNLTVLVRGRVTLTVRQRGSLARFSGRVAGGHVPRRGVTVELQWRDGLRWRPVATMTSDRRGRFSYHYRFSSRARGFRYSFRAVVAKGQVDYPFTPGRSGVRRAGL